MKQCTSQQVIKRSVMISVIAVILLTAVSALSAKLIVSGQAMPQAIDDDQSEPMYATSSLIMVSNSSTDDAVNPLQEGNKVTTNDAESSKMLANTVAGLLTSDPEAKAIISETDTTVEAVEDSYFVRITVSSPDPYKSANTANQLAKASPQIYRKYFGDAGKVDMVEEANVPAAPVSAAKTTTEDKNEQTYVLYIILIAALSALSFGMIISIIVTYLIYVSHKNKYANSIVDNNKTVDANTGL